MAAERMSPTERLWAAIRLEKPDRVPVLPTLLPEPVAALAGLSLAQVAADSNLVVDAFFQIFDRYGGWENPYPAACVPRQLQAVGSYPLKMRVPGKDLPDDQPFQIDEQEVMQRTDYATICAVGMERFYYDDYLWRVSDLTPGELPATLAATADSFGRFAGECTRRGVQPFFMGYGLHPFFTLSLMRSMVPFTQDLYYHPELVEPALQRMTADLIAKQIPLIKASGINLWLLTEERASGYFYPPAIFERFWWPYTRAIIDVCWAEGIVTLFHLDQCWDKNIRYFRQLPKGSAVLELDSATNIFAAKNILRGHLCLRGDVPAALLAIGKPEEVAAYCRRLIDEVGGDGGFILGSGCSVPPNVKADNFRAMIETGKHYELSRSA